nr:MTH1187 family thiamine-binding protein [Candidatus Njordarchaeum guaymaensis]
MVVVVELSIIPLGEGPSVGKHLAHAVRALEGFGVKFEVTPMSTVFEAEDVEGAFEAVKAAHEAVFLGTNGKVKRVITTVKVDDRRDVEKGMEEKVKSIMEAVEAEEQD